jgi:hypothetical protein
VTVFCSHQDRLQEQAGVGRFLIASSSRQMKRLRARFGRAIDRAIAVLGSPDDWSLEPVTHGDCGQHRNAAKFPQRPLILGDKWDF